MVFHLPHCERVRAHPDIVHPLIPTMRDSIHSTVSSFASCFSNSTILARKPACCCLSDRVSKL